jgi:hypothetical protein
VIVLDTTVLVYAKGADSPYRDPCRRLIDAVATATVQATTTVEVIQEFVHVRARRRGRTDAAELGADYVDLFTPLLTVNEEALSRGLELYRRHGQLGAFDAVLAAAAIESGAIALVSADLAFASVPRIEHVLPDDAGVAQILRAG